jgi:inner membrane protein
MLFFAHIGITAGAAKTCDIFLSLTKHGKSQESDSHSEGVPVIGRQRLRLSHLLSRMKSRIDPIDYRMVLLGSLLPDIIDKPVFLLTANNVSFSGRAYAHTLLFNLILLIAGLVLIRYRKFWLLIISLSSFMHLILDQMWNSPAVLFWPLLGPLPKGETAGWVSSMYHSLYSCPEVYIPEIIGFVIILLFAYSLVKRKSIISFIKSGAIG